MHESLEARIAAVAALDEPNRRRLYEHVVGQPEAVSREEAAAALQLPRTTAAFHLDRLVEEGLLDVVYARRTGRSGPGAGRPAKLYRRSQHQLNVSLPERRYELAGRMLAAALHEAEQSGDPPRAVLERRSYQLGVELGAAARAADPPSRQTAMLEILEAYGFEPRPQGPAVVLGNCPFHALAQEYPETVCRMNQHLLDGLLQGLGETRWRARPRHPAGRCCVDLQPTPDDETSSHQASTRYLRP